MKRFSLAILILLAGVLQVAAQSGVGGGGQSNVSGGGTGANGTSQTFGGSPSSGYTFSVVSGTTYATNNKTGAVDYSGSDAAVVINSVLGALSSTGGRLFFKNGVYNLNSATQESNSGCTNFYSIGVPPAALNGAGVQWIFEGESRTVWQGESLPTVAQTNGVIFNVTAAAITAAGSSQIFAIWARPNAAGTSCTIVGTGGFSAVELYFKNLDVRFPVNTRGNEGGIVPWAAYEIDYEDVLVDFAVPYNTIATGSAPAVGASNSFGLSTTYSSSGNLQHFKDTYVVGYNICYDFESEHVVMDSATAIYCNIAGEFGRQGTTMFHPSIINHFSDQENGAGFLFGPNMAQGSRIDMFGLDFEFGNDANWYTTARGKTPKLTETNPGFSTGFITYQATLAGVGAIASAPASTLFTSGGGGFQEFEGTQNPNLAYIPVADTFTRANSSVAALANGLGPAWQSGTQAGNSNLKIVSNSAQVNNAAAGGGYSSYIAQPFNNDQWSKATVASINASASTFFEVMTNLSANPAVQTYYAYYCSNVAAGGSGILKNIAGASTTLTSQTSAVGCVANDTLELRNIGGTLWAYRNGVLDKSFTPNPVSDSSISGGSPGLILVQSAAGVVSATNWSGGNFPTFHGTDSVFANETYHTKYNTLTNCAVNSVSPAACGSAASGAFVVPTTTTTYTVNTTAVTATSRIFLIPTTDASNLPSAPTCVAPPTGFIGIQSARVVGTSFTFTLPSTTGTSCWNYWIVN